MARRKVEGPKKIEDIHKDARMELQRQRMAPMPDRGDRRRGGPPMDRAPLPQCAPHLTHLLHILALCVSLWHPVSPHDWLVASLQRSWQRLPV